MKWIDLWGEAACRIIEFGVPNQERLIMQRQEIEADGNLVGVIGTPENKFDIKFDIKFDEIAAYGKIIPMADGVYMVINPSPGDRGKLLKEGVLAGAEILPVGTGCIDENGHVWDYRLLYFYINL